MKKRNLLIVTLIVFIIGCKKNDPSVEATVTRDCTGTYVQIKGQDYMVCNYKKLQNFNEGDKILIAYTPIETCNSDQIVCMMFRQHSGIVEITNLSRP